MPPSKKIKKTPVETAMDLLRDSDDEAMGTDACDAPSDVCR
jgi:hypothetical protein